MRRESSLLIFLLLLAATPVGAQDDLNDEDLQSLLNDRPAEAAEVSNEAKDSVSSPDSELSSETVDIESSITESPVEELATEVEQNIEPQTTVDATKQSGDEVVDDLEALKEDIGDEGIFIPSMATPDKVETPAEAMPKADKKIATPQVPPKIEKVTEVKVEEPAVFDVGKEERELLGLAQNIQGQISNDEWNELATAAKAESYTVVQNDWLFKISKRFFGTGFYYPKIWSLNSFITNPHFIEPGMVLSFTTGSAAVAPEFKLGSFTEEELSTPSGVSVVSDARDFSNFGDDTRPDWIDEKDKLVQQGTYFQYASEETTEDLLKEGKKMLSREYEAYEPPGSDFDLVVPSSSYDSLGFDKSSKIFYSVKEGFYLSTFASTNILQDFGPIVNGPDENIFFSLHDRAYVQFDESINALPGDKFSVYSAGGRLKHENSDREGYKYAITAQVKLIRKIREKWEVEFIELAGTPQRGDRITVFTPKIDRITRTFNSRLVEAGILASYQPSQMVLGFGDVVYLDRGRADGVEMGNVFDVYGFKDRLTGKNITDQPTYKTGELTVITLTDNFATAVVTKSSRDFHIGDIAITRTKESHLRELKAKEARGRGDKDTIGGKALEELDVELNLENLNEDLLKEADKIQLTEDELAELERQEREKSVIKDSERDLKALERLETELEHAESILNDAKLDEDKLLEGENLNEIEKKRASGMDQDSLDEIEENLGKRYVDEDLNSKDNPFGLSEFDVEEIDELLNTEKKQQ